MIKELYTYACPKLSVEQGNPFNILYVLCITSFSSLAILFGNVVLGVVITALYLGLSLLSFLDKDLISRYMKLATLCVFDVFGVGLCLFSKIFSGYRFSFWTIICGIIISVIYEIVIFFKIKNRLYTSPTKKGKSATAVSISAVALGLLAFKLLSSNPDQKALLVMALTVLCSVVMLGCIMGIQKLVIYSITKNKIEKQNEFDTN